MSLHIHLAAASAPAIRIAVGGAAPMLAARASLTLLSTALARLS